MSVSYAKQVAAEKALGLLRDRLANATRIGVGTGSTVAKIVELIMDDPGLARAMRTARVYASSLATLLMLRRYGVEAYSYTPRGGLDVYFDGADEVAIGDGECMLVKGRGAAMVREKILAYNSRYTVIVVDESKVSSSLGEKGKPVPVEVLEYALEALLDELNALGVRAEVRSGCGCRDGPALTDNSGIVVDTWPWGVVEPSQYEALLDRLPGVVGHGLFIGYADAVVVGRGEGGAAVYSCRRTRRNPAL
ncbi:ribose 5-phosphate isomerase A [Pyrodictium abyssi]|uniref:Ribose 5-phosphate isomerase A n=1 Tax=Pyrodictium abyssi TaxID=54256 RepID=A0ABM8IWK3_9CREN|nr:ribose-5-phosphate isomerase RpiA [Pyrodictium abyssi]